MPCRVGELLDWADEAKAIIIEDDYDSEYRYVGTLPAMSLDRKARVIYSGSFSKVFSPLLRLGYIVVPKSLAERFRAERLAHGAPPSLMAQPALCEFMTAGAFAIHIRRMRRFMARREALIEALKDARTSPSTLARVSCFCCARNPENDEEMVAKLGAGIEAIPLKPLLKK
jgi:GntR family transcriptional regulator/MocR family aminotransferase